MRHYALVVSLLILSSISPFAQEPDRQGTDDVTAIKEVLIDSYIKGIHIERDSIAVRSGFHPSFLMHVYADGQIIQANLEMWLQRLNLDGVKNTDQITYTFQSIEVSGTAATVRMELYENSKHLYTDYFGMYKFTNGWQIINKIFYAYQ